MAPAAVVDPNSVHDLLVIPSNGQLYRAKAETDGSGYRAAPQAVSFDDVAYRKVMGIARPSGGAAYGPAFSVLPTREDPASSQICCYLINSENLHAQNPWTVAEWSSEPAAAEDNDEPEPVPQAAPLDLLVALGDGTVMRVRANEPMVPIDLPNESEVYLQLRNGLVAGTVFCRAAGRVLPIVNITSLSAGGGQP